MSAEGSNDPEAERPGDAPAPARLRVAFLIWRLHPSGGIPRFQSSLLGAVADRPWLDLHVISVRPNYPEDWLDQYGSHATFHFLDLDGASTIPKRLKALARLATVLRGLRPDVLHVNGGIGWLAAPLPHTGAVVLQVHDPPQTGRDSAFTSAVERWATRWRGWQPVAASSGVAEQLVEAWRLDPTAVRIEPLGIDTDHFSPVTPTTGKPKAPASTPSAIAAVFVARLVPSKQPHQFVELAARWPDAEPHTAFRLAGDGPLASELAERIRRDRIACELTGPIPDTRDFLRTADVFVSTSSAEGFGLAVLEAMAVGVPVVAFAANGFRDLIVDGETGFVVPVDDLDALANRLSRLVNDPALRAAMGAAAVARARRFSLEAMGERYVQLWSDMAPDLRADRNSAG